MEERDRGNEPQPSVGFAICLISAILLLIFTAVTDTWPFNQ